MTHEKIILVTRETRLEALVKRFNTLAQARFYIQHNGGDFTAYEREHHAYHAALSGLRQGLRRAAKLQELERAFLPNFLFSADDIVITLGIDGLVVNTAKYLQGQPLLAVNPDPEHIDGILLPFDVKEALALIPNVLQGKLRTRAITMAEVRLNDGQSMLAFNDFFIGRNDQISARYRIQSGAVTEQHSSSGLIVSTGAGSTGWLSSVFNMSEGIMAQFGDRDESLRRPQLGWETDRLLFMVREPFISRTSAASLVCGSITAEKPLLLESTMPDGGVIFSDGITQDYLSFNAGSRAVIGLAAQKTQLVVG